MFFVKLPSGQYIGVNLYLPVFETKALDYFSEFYTTQKQILDSNRLLTSKKNHTQLEQVIEEQLNQ